MVMLCLQARSAPSRESASPEMVRAVIVGAVGEGYREVVRVVSAHQGAAAGFGSSVRGIW